MLSDLRYVLRSLRRTRGFTLVTVLTLALGIGSATAIFSVVDWVLFRSVDFPDDLVIAGSRGKDGQFQPAIVEADRQVLAGLEDAFAETAVAARQSVNVAFEGEPVSSSVFEVAANFLPVLGIQPARGRNFQPDDVQSGRSDVVIVRHEFWREHLRGDPDAIGRTLVVGDTVCTIIGVLPPRQAMPVFFHADVFRPLVTKPDPANPFSPWYFFIARLRPGVSMAQASEIVQAAHFDPPARVQAFFRERTRVVTSLREMQRFMRPEIYWMLVGAVGFLYAIACLNASNLMLVRMLGRRRELSIRMALGSSRRRLARLCFLEGFALSLAASIAAIVVANWLVPLLMSLAEAQSAFNWARWSLDWRATAVMAAMAIGTAVAIALVPALRLAGTDVNDGLKEGGTMLGESRRLARLRGGFVVLQAMFAVILLVGAGLMVRTFERLDKVPLGFDPHQRIKAALMFPQGHVAGKDERLAWLQQLRARLEHVPGVAAASYGTDSVLPGYYYAGTSVQLADGTEIKVKLDYVSPGFLETAGMTLERGRMIAAPGEVLLNESFARVRYGEADPIGQLLHPTDTTHGTSGWLVVGVVADIRETLRSAPGYHVYAPEVWWPPAMDTFIVRVSRADAAMSAAIKRAIYEHDAKVVAYVVAPLTEVRNWQHGIERFVASVLKVLSGLALALTVVGLFSVLLYTVDCRRGEFGVRLALGATSRDLAHLVLRRGLRLTSAGVTGGLAVGLALTRFMESLLFETTPHDPLILASVAIVLLVAAVIACAFPAWRAANTNLAHLLRAQ